jgi:hypothetical protein
MIERSKGYNRDNNQLRMLKEVFLRKGKTEMNHGGWNVQAM